MNAIGYHSVYLDPHSVSPVQQWTGGGCTAFIHDLLAGPLPEIYRTCDVLFADLPWRDGFPRYNARAGINDDRTYPAFLDSVSEALNSHGRPAVLLTGQHALKRLPVPAQTVQVTMPVLRQQGVAVFYNMTASEPWTHARDVIAYLAATYDRVGDFCCGYGWSARAFYEAGKTFVASDYNPECIGYIAAHVKEWQRP